MHWFVSESKFPLPNDGLPKYKYLPTALLKNAGATDEDIAHLKEGGMELSDELLEEQQAEKAVQTEQAEH